MKPIAVVASMLVTSFGYLPMGQPTPDCQELLRAMQERIRAAGKVTDLAQLGRYRDANRALQASERRVVFLGDSITDYWSQPRFGGFFPNKPYVNRGVGGQTTAHMLLRFRQDVIALRPEVVVILAGINDIALGTGPTADEESQANLMSMCELAQANRIRVVLSSIMPVSDYHRRLPGMTMTALRPPSRIVSMNSWIRAYATEHSHIYLDYYSAMVDASGMLREDLSDDDVHPNAKGYAVMATLAEPAIRRALGSSAPER